MLKLFQKSPSRKLWEAVENQNFVKAKYLLENEKDININYFDPETRNSILNIAVFTNNLPIIKLLFSSKYATMININNVGKYYELENRRSLRATPIAFAKYWGYKDIEVYLLGQLEANYALSQLAAKMSSGN